MKEGNFKKTRKGRTYQARTSDQSKTGVEKGRTDRSKSTLSDRHCRSILVTRVGQTISFGQGKALREGKQKEVTKFGKV